MSGVSEGVGEKSGVRKKSSEVVRNRNSVDEKGRDGEGEGVGTSELLKTIDVGCTNGELLLKGSWVDERI